MAIQPDRGPYGRSSHAGRLVGVVLGFVLVGWAVSASGVLWSEAKFRNVTRRIMSGETFRSETLSDLQSEIEGSSTGFLPYPDLLRSIALIRLRQAELEYQAGNGTLNNAAFDRADAAVRNALAVAPSDGFLWFSQAWMALARYRSPETIKRMLAMSYQTSGHEGWVAIRRTAVALTAFPILDIDLRRSAVGELQDLALTDIYIYALAQALAGPGARYRDMLLPALQFAPEDNRKRLSSMLVELGVDAAVPGIPSRGDRPWN